MATQYTINQVYDLAEEKIKDHAEISRDDSESSSNKKQKIE